MIKADTVILFEILDFNHQALLYKDTDIYDKDNFYRVAWGKIFVIKVIYVQWVSVRIIFRAKQKWNCLNVSTGTRKKREFITRITCLQSTTILYGTTMRNTRDF